MTVADQTVRDRALDIGTSFAVSAPAGSGKTGLLIRRILRLLAVCEQPEQVLAITFTRKAAAEMHERIVAALHLASNNEPPKDDYLRGIWQDARAVLERDRQQNWQLIAAPARLRIMTIDSLCRNLARQLAVETGLGELPEPSDQPEFFYREAMRGLFAQLEQPGAVGDALALLLTHLDNNLASLESLLETLLAKREQWLEPLLASRHAREYLEQTLQNTVAEGLQNARNSLATVASELALLGDYAAANLSRDNPANCVCQLAGLTDLPDCAPTAVNLQRWMAVGELLLTGDNGWRKPKGITKRQGFPTKKDSTDPANADIRKQQLNDVIAWCEQQPGLLQQLIDLRHLPAIAYSDGQWHLLDALTLVLPVLVAELSVLFKTRHSCDFTEVTLAALSALGQENDATELSLKLDYQLRHILVDEFQDTSSLQFRLLKKLTWGWQRGDGRTLFIVGDGMQSLYGFRSANVGIFLEARHQPVGEIHLETLDLQVNFRSDATVVNWVNDTFQQVFPAREDISRGAVAYAEAIAAHSDLPHAAVTCDIFASDGLPLDMAEDEAEQVLARIRQARALEPTGSIAILARARSHLTAIIAALQQQGIAWEATDIDPLSSRMAVIDLFSLTRALLNPADRIAWLAILRAPWCGLALADMHAIAHLGRVPDGRPEDLPWLAGQIFAPDIGAHLSEDGRARLERIAPILQAAWQNRLRKPLRQWIEGTWLALGGPAALANSSHLAWCEQYFDLLEQQSCGAELNDLDKFTQAVDKLYARPTTGHRNPVQIMTIHKSKGLEFDTVILPGLHKGSRNNGSALLFWRERVNQRGEAELLIAPPFSDDTPEDSDQLVKHLKYEEKLKNALEDARVLYVACTRARKRLHLFFHSPSKAPASGSLLAALWPALENNSAETVQVQGAGWVWHSRNPTNEATGWNDVGLRSANPTYDSAQTRSKEIPFKAAPASQPDIETVPSLRDLLRLSSHWCHPFLPSTPTAIPAGQPYQLSAPDNDPARHLGTVLHRTLQQIVSEGLENWHSERIARQHPAWQIQLRQLGLDDVAPATNVLEQALTTMLADPKGRWLLADHPQSASELALGYATEQGIGQVVIDRTFVDEDVRWIVDYKSTAPRESESLAEFTQRETENYRQQLAGYRQVFAARETREIRAALYFPLLPLFVEI